MVGRQPIIMLLLLLLLPLAQAYGVERVWVDFEGAHVRTIAPGVELPGAVVKLKLTNDLADCLPGGKLASSTCMVYLRAGALSTKPAERQVLNSTRLEIRGCQNTTAGIICSSAPFTFSTRSQTNQIQHMIRTAGRDTGWATVNIPIILDNTTPRATALDIGYCTEETCYASTVFDTPYRITFDDTVTAFDYRLIFVGKQGVFDRVDNCTGKTCSGSVKLSCLQGQTETIQIIPAAGIASREDAQNNVVGISRSVTCTSESPKFLDEFIVTYDHPLGVGVAGGGVTYKNRVQVPHGRPRGVLYSAELNGINETIANCIQEGTDLTVWQCTWSVRNLSAGKHDLHFSIFSATGNKDDHKKLSITVREPITAVNMTESRFSAVLSAQPQPMNRLALDLARQNSKPYPLYVPYTINRQRGSATIVRQELKECWYKNESETNYTKRLGLFSFGGSPPESRVFIPGAAVGEQNRLTLQIRADRNVLKQSDSFDAVCGIALIVAEGDQIYTTPVLVNLSFKVLLRESPLGEPGKAFVTEIQRLEKELTEGDAKNIQRLEDYRLKLDKVCTGIEGVVQVQQTLANGMMAAGGMCSGGVTAAAGGPLAGILNEVYGPMSGFKTVAWDGGIPVGGTPDTVYRRTKNALIMSGKFFAPNNAILHDGGFMRTVCTQVNCRVPQQAMGPNTNFQSGFTNSMTQGSGFGSTLVKEVVENANVADPQASMVGAVSTMCLGGVIYNLNKDVAIDCGHLQCLKEQSLRGSSVSTCALGTGFRKCMQVQGEIGELPFLRTFKNIANNINSIIKNLPFIALKWGQVEACNHFEGSLGTRSCTGPCPNWPCYVCRFTGTLITYVDAQQQTTRAIQGISDTEGAKKALQVCKDATGNAPDQTKLAQRGYQALLGEMARDGAAAQDAQYQAMSTGKPMPAVDSTNYDTVNRVDAAWAQAFHTQDGQQIEGTQLPRTYSAYDSYFTYDESRGSLTLRNMEGQEFAVYESGLTPKEYEAMKTTLANEHMLRQMRAAGKPSAENPIVVDGIIIRSESQLNDYYRRKIDYDRTNAQMNQQGAAWPPADQNRVFSAASQFHSACRGEAKQCDATIERLANDGILCSRATNSCTITCKSKTCEGQQVTVTDDAGSLAAQKYNERNAALASAMGTYAAKWLFDKGYYDQFRTAVYSVVPGYEDLVEEADRYLNYQRRSQILCEEKWNIKDNDEGAVFMVNSGIDTPVVATFGAEVQEFENESFSGSSYVVVAYVTNPDRSTGGTDFMLNITLTDLSDCTASQCPREISITNGAAFNLSRGTSFSNGNMPKTRLLYLPGKYGKMCLNFDKPFPGITGSRQYCRSISEKTFDTGSPVVPTAAAPNTPAPAATVGAPPSADPTEGWA